MATESARDTRPDVLRPLMSPWRELPDHVSAPAVVRPRGFWQGFAGFAFDYNRY